MSIPAIMMATGIIASDAPTGTPGDTPLVAALRLLVAELEDVVALRSTDITTARNTLGASDDIDAIQQYQVAKRALAEAERALGLAGRLT